MPTRRRQRLSSSARNNNSAGIRFLVACGGDPNANAGHSPIFAAAFVLYALIFGAEEAKRIAPPKVVQVGAALGVLIFAGTGVASLFLEGNFLDYNVLQHDPVHGQHLGILLVELGVGTTVAAVMISVFFCFAGRGRS